MKIILFQSVQSTFHSKILTCLTALSSETVSGSAFNPCLHCMPWKIGQNLPAVMMAIVWIILFLPTYQPLQHHFLL